LPNQLKYFVCCCWEIFCQKNVFLAGTFCPTQNLSYFAQNENLKDMERKKLQNQKNRSKFSIKTEQKPVAQTNTVCALRAHQVGSYEWSVQTFDRLKLVSNELANIFVFQYEAGCRISEVLQIEYSDILRDGSVKIKAKKGSNDRIVNCSRIASYLIKCRNIRSNPFSSFNRFFIHRMYKQYGIIFKSENSTKMSTTHALRQLKAESIRQNTDSAELVSQSLGQKNSKNSRYYGKSEKQK